MCSAKPLFIAITADKKVRPLWSRLAQKKCQFLLGNRTVASDVLSLSKTVTNYKNFQFVQQGSDPFGQVFAILTARQHKALQKFSFRKSVTYAIISK